MSKYLDQVETYAASFPTLSDFTSSTGIGYARSGGKYLVAEGDYIKITETGQVLEVLAEGATSEITGTPVPVSVVKTWGVPVEFYGAVGDGATDDAAAIQAAIDSGAPVLLGNSEYLVNSTLNLRDDADNIGTIIKGVGRGQSVIKAGAAIDRILYQGETNIMIGGELSGFALDGNDLAQNCFDYVRGKSFLIDIECIGFLNAGMVMGKDSATGAYCYENHIYNLRIDGGIAKAQADTHPPYGLRMVAGATDNKIFAPVVSYVSDVGFEINGGNNTIVSPHAYGYIDRPFVVKGECELVAPFSDTARISYFKIEGARVQITGGKAFGNTSGGGYNASATAFELDASRAVTILGTRLRNLGTDFNLAPSAASVVSGLTYSGVSTVNYKNYYGGNLTAFSPTFGASLTVDSPNTYTGYTTFERSQVARWYMGMDDTADSGVSVGSNFNIVARNNDGTYLSTPFSIDRDTGATTLAAGDFNLTGGRLNQTDTTSSFMGGFMTLDKGFRANGLSSISGAAGTNRVFGFKSDGLGRAQIRLSSEAESGSDAGSNIEIITRADDGSFLAKPIKIERATGIVTIGDNDTGVNLTVNSSTTTATPSAGAGGALPATPAGYMDIKINDTVRKVPYY